MTGPITGVRSVDFATADLPRAIDFYTKVWSLALVEKTDGEAYLRGQGPYHHIIKLTQASSPGIDRFTFDVAGRDALVTLHGRLKAAGLPVSVSPSRVDQPGGGFGFDSRDPEGRNISFVTDVQDHTTVSLVGDKITKVTHLNLNAGAYETTRAFMVDVLGFRLVDETPINGFFNCNRDHHCIVVGRRQAPTLNHVAFEMPDLDSMMRMAGTMNENGYPIEWGVGRHGPGNNVFGYFAGPEEMPIECTAEVLQIDDSYVYRGPDKWSFPPGRSDQWGVTGLPSARIKRIQNMFWFPDLPLR
jgi:catechol 2,3-dioxygenase-like lactoylglutathione lyase family enzyme